MGVVGGPRRHVRMGVARGFGCCTAKTLKDVLLAYRAHVWCCVPLDMRARTHCKGCKKASVCSESGQRGCCSYTTHRLHEHTRAAIGVWAILGVNGWEGDGVLVVLPEVEVAREPGLDASVLAHKLDELAALLLIRVVEPAAPVDDMVLLKHAQARPVGGGVSEHEDLPAIGRGMVFEDFCEPLHLGCVLCFCHVSQSKSGKGGVF
jgi:hypothetical protein